MPKKKKTSKKKHKKKSVKKQFQRKFLTIALVIIVLIAASFIFISGGDFGSSELRQFNECLAKNEFVVYGDSTCKGSQTLLERLGGIENAEPVFIDCNKPKNQKVCEKEAKAGYVPEVQIDGEVYKGPNSLKRFAEETGCPPPDNE